MNKERAKEFDKEVNEAVRAFMLKITVIAGKYKIDPFALLRDTGTDIICEATRFHMNYEKFKDDFKKGDLEE